MTNKASLYTVMNDPAGAWATRVMQSIPTSYTIWKDGSTYRAESNIDGGPDYSGTNATTVLLAAIGNNRKIFLKSGTYILDQYVLISGMSNLIIQGEGKDATILQVAAGKDGVGIGSSNHITMSDLTIDAKTNDAECPIVISTVSNVSLQRCKFLGSANVFSVYWVGPAGASLATPIYDKYNSMIDCEVYDLYDGDGISWSFQQFGTLSHVYEKGSRLALYACKDCNVDNFIYEKETAAGTAQQGIWVTNPSENLNFNNTVLVDAGYPRLADTDLTYLCEGLNINNFFQIATTNDLSSPLQFKYARKVAINNFRANYSGGLNFVTGCQDIQVQNSFIPQVTFLQGVAETLANLRFSNNTLPAFTPKAGQSLYAFENFNNGLFTDLIVKNNKIYSAGTFHQLIGNSGVTIKENIGFLTENSGSNTGTGAQQTIPHGVAAGLLTPNDVTVIPNVTGATVSSVWADATNIYCTVTNGKTYNWTAKVV
jgi:hypothetical protein